MFTTYSGVGHFGRSSPSLLPLLVGICLRLTLSQAVDDSRRAASRAAAAGGRASPALDISGTQWALAPVLACQWVCHWPGPGARRAGHGIEAMGPRRPSTGEQRRPPAPPPPSSSTPPAIMPLR
jgi:hypothetical protein